MNILSLISIGLGQTNQEYRHKRECANVVCNPKTVVYDEANTNCISFWSHIFYW